MTTPVWAAKNTDIDINAGIQMRYDDNVTTTNANAIDDFITSLKVGLGLSNEGRTHTLKAKVNFTQDLYADNTGFNNNAQDVGLNLVKELSKNDKIILNDNFVHAEEPGSFDDEFGRGGGRYSYYDNRFRVEYNRSFSSRWGAAAKYENTYYDPSRANLSKSLRNRGIIELIFTQSSANAFLWLYDFVKQDRDPGASAKTHSVLAGVRHYFTKQLFGDVRAGVSFIEGFTGKNSQEPKIMISLTDELSEKTRFNLTYVNQHSPSNFNQGIFDSWRVTGSVNQKIQQRLSAILTGFYGEGKFAELGIRDDLIGVRARLTYDVSEDIEAYCAYTYSETDSNVSSRSYEKNVIMMGFDVSF